MIEYRTVDEYWERYHALDPAVRRRADKQFALLKSDPHHPSLQFKKIGERDGGEIWSARVTLNFRAVAIKRPYGFLWFWIGNHETYDWLIG